MSINDALPLQAAPGDGIVRGKDTGGPVLWQGFGWTHTHILNNNYEGEIQLCAYLKIKFEKFFRGQWLRSLSDYGLQCPTQTES